MGMVHYRYASVNGRRLFYREAGSADAPTIVLLHGFPTSSFMFRDLIPQLADHYHLIAPDHLGFGFSDAPPVAEFDYTFDALADLTAGLLDELGLSRYTLYVHDYGAPIGWRLALRRPDTIAAIITQNGNGYDAGFVDSFWKTVWDYQREQNPDTEAAVRAALRVDSLKWQYLTGVPEESTVSPDTWTHDFALLSRPGNDEIQLKLFLDYATNPPMYPALHDYLRTSEVPVLAVWGRNDPIFGPEGALAFSQDSPNAEIHLLDGGHFLLESAGEEVAALIRAFLTRIEPAWAVRSLPQNVAATSSSPHLLPTAPAVVREQSGGETMRAIVLEKFGGLDSLVYTDIPKPLPKDGEVVIKVKGFGINHAEVHMRRGEWAEAAEVSGIECVGIVDSCPGAEFPVGAKVAALMGGLGRSINGSYAEYTRVRASNVALIDSELPWAQLAALPETYATAWTCLFRNLALSAEQSLVIRGATSSLGQAAVKMAVNAGSRVIATTRSRERFAMLEKLGASRAELEVPNLAARIREAKEIDGVLDLVGNSTILDSLDMLRRGGSACLAGWLGGLAPIPDFNPLLRMASGVNLTFFGSFVFGTPGFPLSDVPLQDIARQVRDGRLEAKPSRVFSFDQIHEAHRVMEAGQAGGKMVVVLD
jgi:NADPH:quinone reductase